MTTRTLTLTLPRRRQIEQIVEGLIALLDHCDGDCDLEDNADSEPSLGWQSVMLPTDQVVVDVEYADSDLEHSVGWGFHRQPRRREHDQFI